MCTHARMKSYGLWVQIIEHEKRYVIHDLELATVVLALKMWRHYPYGERFKVHSRFIQITRVFSICLGRKIST